MIGKCISIGVGSVVGDGGIEGTNHLVGSVALAVFTSGEEFIQVLVNIVSSFVPQQLADLIDAL